MYTNNIVYCAACDKNAAFFTAKIPSVRICNVCVEVIVMEYGKLKKAKIIQRDMIEVNDAK